MKVIAQRGFTLIELMIVLVIVAILASIAVPSYQNSVMKSRRADAKAALSAAAAEQEKWFFQFMQYSGDVDDIGGNGSGLLLSPEGFYTVTVTNPSAGTCTSSAPFNCYTLTATPTVGGPQEEDTACTTFVLAHTGARSATGSNSSSCW